ncbi:hypothetical protein AAGW05_08735 [Arthrobacter sp. LAPM80]|uniref:hypothetical protein n=1 Tax=Arthrobacter sp. LAPM80 TaxID=3141788 RepID=UPI00398BADAE
MPPYARLGMYFLRDLMTMNTPTARTDRSRTMDRASPPVPVAGRSHADGATAGSDAAAPAGLAVPALAGVLAGHKFTSGDPLALE